MSSFIGHSLVAWTIGSTASRTEISTRRHNDFLWLGWLIVVALAPDLDYILPILHPSAHAGLRITHSLLACQLLPILTLIYLRFKEESKPVFWASARQLILAGFSHIGLDLLVGVTALPLMSPLSDQVFKLPFGVLPSAGKLSLFNYYLYYNLAIELGVLVPLSFCWYYLRASKKLTWRGWLIVGFLLLLSGRCMYWSYRLSR